LLVGCLREQSNRVLDALLNRRLGFCLDSAMPIGSLVGRVFRPVGRRRCEVPAGVAPSGAVASGTGPW
jgi:hypothetical protein